MENRIFNSRWQTYHSMGESGQSVTYLARDLAGKESGDVVIKVIKDVNREHRMIAEIMTLKDLDHPRIHKLIDTSLADDELWMATRYCRGGNLNDAVLDFLNDHDFVLTLYAQVLEGVKYLHQHDPVVVHRDIKPENILLESERGPAVVADFGICYVEGMDRYTQTNEQVGARFFIAPELEEGRLDRMSPASDVYSLGKLLYWMCSGKRKLAREKHRDSKYNLMGQYDEPGLEHINRLLDRMIVETPDRRFRDAVETLEAFNECVRLIRGGFNVVAKGIPQRCTYCGIGTYKFVAHNSSTDAYNFGLRPTGAGAFHVLVCNKCGHSQIFRLDHAEKRSEWWGV